MNVSNIVARRLKLPQASLLTRAAIRADFIRPQRIQNPNAPKKPNAKPGGLANHNSCQQTHAGVSLCLTANHADWPTTTRCQKATNCDNKLSDRRKA